MSERPLLHGTPCSQSVEEAGYPSFVLFSGCFMGRGHAAQWRGQTVIRNPSGAIGSFRAGMRNELASTVSYSRFEGRIRAIEPGIKDPQLKVGNHQGPDCISYLQPCLAKRSSGRIPTPPNFHLRHPSERRRDCRFQNDDCCASSAAAGDNLPDVPPQDILLGGT